jgi:hypothetical protein
MSDSRSRASAAVVIFLFLHAATAWGQTTGRIVGRVVDSTGAVLPGVAVTATSPSLQGTSAATTDGEGNYRFLLLPPGTYSLKASLSGFKTVEQPNVVVGLDRTVEVILQLAVASVAETVHVEAASPVVDTTSTTLGVTAKADLLDRLPIQRDIYTVSRLAPGVTSDAIGPAVYGSTGAENQYIVDGLNVTGLRAGREAKNLNFDFVDSIEVKTGGLPAEYGRVTGGTLNVVTKSGGNEFHGLAFGFNSGGGLQATNTTAADRPQTTTTVSNIDRQWDYGGTLGGYIMKDRLWFFGSYAHMFQREQTRVIRVLSAPGSPSIGSQIPADTDTDTFAGKMTYKLTTAQTIVGSINGDPSRRVGNVFTIAGPESTWKGEEATGGPDGVLKYTGAFGSSLVLDAEYGRHYERGRFSGAGANLPLLVDLTVTPGADTGGFGGYSNDTFTRNYYAVKVTKYLGVHEIKGGVDWEDNSSAIDRYSGGGGKAVVKFALGQTIYYLHGFLLDDRSPGFDRTNPATWKPANPLTSKPDTLNTSVFAQDNWRVRPNVSVNAGLRWERQQIKDRNNATVIDLTTNWAPRLGAVWDFAGNGRSKLFAGYGRYYESIPLDIDIRSFGGELSCGCYNFDPDPGDLTPDPAAPRPSRVLGGSTEPVDPNLRGQYVNEVVAGTEYEIAPNLTLGVKYVHRALARVIEDFLIPSEGTYFVANPGQGLGKTMAFYCVNSDCGPGNDGTVAAPKAKRTNDSVEVSLRKSFAHHWQVLASYVWSRLEGNYDGTYQNSTGQLDPNINSAFDYADFLVNADGKLTNDRIHEIKFDGSYEFSGGPLHGLNAALSTHWYSGLPTTTYGFSFAYGGWEYYLTPRGELGHSPSDWEADIHVNYPITLRGSRKINLVMNTFNLFNRQAAIELDQRYNLVQDGPCAGVPEGSCNGDGGLVTSPGTLTPIAQLGAPRATATNPDFLKKGFTFTSPRSLQIGVRFEF